MIRRWCVLLAWACSLLPSAWASAQSRPEIVDLVTNDGVQLKVSYFASPVRPGSPQGKLVTPVVLLHDLKETRATFTTLAQRLQAVRAGDAGGGGFAAVTVDLRGHGDSNKQVLPSGETLELDAVKLKRNDFFSMAGMDMTAVRSFLVGKNDAGELNLNKLCVLGSGMGAAVAANFAAQDWSWPPLAIGKQGQDVKALVLVSPKWSFNGLSFQAPLRFRALKENVAWMLIYGAESPKSAADVRRIYKQLERFHPEPAAGAAQQAGRSLVEVALQSKLQGSTLIRQVGEPIEQQIVTFLTEQVATKAYPWSSRRTQLPQ